MEITRTAPEAAAERIDQLLAELRGRPDRRAADLAEELIRCLVQLYGAGLTRIAAGLGADQLEDLCADPLVESLLLVHDLHPMDTGTRIRRALERLRDPGLEYLGVDEAGVVRVRLPAGGGCPSSRQAVVHRIESIVMQAAPEVTDVVVEAPTPALPLLQVSVRPGGPITR
ncbi:NifU family protein [Couchioplanes caeruleus]|uniref:Uncharacterized protein n=2 Tax=Couchioplanes caeruleus TaxID=56438 RepID=A0A1K0GJI4_9ACTN|nr:NifU family protein [Couchioplanes caeruleus]OJF11108.1 hypothetical protein BG844_28635 [Couchioplanes caeruleus subsp. caeruleus]ROP33744.1 NifU-like protein [Couchioplanes caeruleus]